MHGGDWFYIAPSGYRTRALRAICETCGDEFMAHRKAPVARFCGRSCWRKACVMCGASFYPQSARQVYCSDECKRGLAICENCGQSFVPGKKTARRFCTRQCWADKLVSVGSTHRTKGGYVNIRVSKGTPGAN